MTPYTKLHVNTVHFEQEINKNGQEIGKKGCRSCNSLNLKGGSGGLEGYQE